MSRKITIIVEDDGIAQGLSIGQSYYRPYSNNPCEFCNNNPAVNPHASGICNCALPALANPVYC